MSTFGEKMPRRLTEQEPDFKAILESASVLGQVSMRLRMVGPVALVLSLANFAILLWGIVRSNRGDLYIAESMALTNLVLTVVTISVLGYFESLRKRGDAIFQELSDELQWYVGRSGSHSIFEGSSQSSSPRDRPLLEVRLMMRAFSAAAELPLSPGSSGGALYAFFNLMIAIASAVLLAR
jgi:hypothetical protein